MRKITSLVLCILMLATLAVPAMAADVPTFVLTADMDEVVTGDIVTITVSVAEGNTASCSNFGVIVKYDKSKFEFVSVDGDDNQGGMQMSILANPTGTIDTNIFAGSNNGDPYPGVGAWNTKPSEGTNPGQTAMVPSGKVGYVKLKCIVAEGTVGTADITGIASVDGGNTSTVTPVTVNFVESKGIWGDADDNGVVDTNDASYILEYCVSLKTADQLNLAVSDVDGNNAVDTNDASLILEYCVSLRDHFPVEE